MMTTHARAAYLDTSVVTADPAHLLVMLCDRLVLDVRRGLAALEATDLPEAHVHLVHAQAIVTELRTSLRPELFAGGEQLGRIYDYLLDLLVQGNVHKDAVRIGESLGLAQSIAETWREAATAAGALA